LADHFSQPAKTKLETKKARLPLATGFFIPKWRDTKPIEINDEATTPLFSMNAN
jgi:hypothetical protein